MRLRPLELVAATRNADKIARFVALVEGLATVEPLPAEVALPVSEEELEAGDDLGAIAAAKAATWSRIVPGEFVIASDGGLLVPALGERWNPARTKRFAGVDMPDLDRARALLELAKGLVGEERAIGWRETVAIARDGALLAEFTAESEPGLLADALDEAVLARGRGFWIPVLWRCPTFDGRLLVDLTAAERERLDDHWRRLRAPVRNWLRAYTSARRS